MPEIDPLSDLYAAGWTDIRTSSTAEGRAVIAAMDPRAVERVAHAYSVEACVENLLALFAAENPLAPPVSELPVDASAPVASPVPTSEATGVTPESVIGETPIGTESDLLIGKICAASVRIRKNRIEARYDANARERQRNSWLAYTHKSDLGLPISEEEQAAYAEWLGASEFDRKTRDHSDAICAAAIDAPLEMLRVMFAHIEEGWP